MHAAVLRGIAQTKQLRENPLASTVTAGRRGRPRKTRGPEEALEAEKSSRKRQKRENEEIKDNSNPKVANSTGQQALLDQVYRNSAHLPSLPAANPPVVQAPTNSAMPLKSARPDPGAASDTRSLDSIEDPQIDCVDSPPQNSSAAKNGLLSSRRPEKPDRMEALYAGFVEGGSSLP